MNHCPHVIVVGAGLSGLSAALEIEKLGGKVTLIERSDRIGGRVRTDEEQGFLLDRGFQVLLSSYPEIQRLDLSNELKLKAFDSGAFCCKGSSSYHLVNPFRHFVRFLTNVHKVPYFDFFKLARLLYSKQALHRSTSELLEELRISFDTRHDFLEPFFGGVFLDIKLEARAELFIDYLRLFLKGLATLPEKGMEALPKAMYKNLKSTELLLNEEVKDLADHSVSLASGKEIKADAVIVSVDNVSLKNWVAESQKITSKSVRCFYFSIPQNKIKKSPFLYLGSDGPIANLCIPNHIQATYAPKGFDLISASVVDFKWQNKSELLQNVEESICSWFSLKPDDLSFIKEYHIPHALPEQKRSPDLEKNIKLKGFERVFLSGEITEVSSINGALKSGRKAASVLIKELM